MENNDEITTAEAAKILGVSARHIGWYYGQGLLPGRRIGARLLVFRRSDVDAFEKPKRPGRPPKATVGSPKKPGKVAPAPEAKTGKAAAGTGKAGMKMRGKKEKKE